MKIVNDKLIGSNIVHVNTKKKSRGKLNPKFLVMHYTAGTSFESDLRTLSTSAAKVSCHLVVGPGGEIGQVGSFKDIQWHAGRSKWKGLSGLNKYSIGIEVTCPGPVEYVGDDKDLGRTFETWSGQKLYENNSPWSFVQRTHRNGGRKKWWAVFSEAQNEILTELIPLLVDKYNLEVVGHDDIAPGRKQDPGPSMPPSLWHTINGNKEEDDDNDVEDLSSKEIQIWTPDNSKLNMRSAPNGRIIGSIPYGYIVTKIGEAGKWSKIKTPAGYVGWVYSPYTQDVN